MSAGDAGDPHAGRRAPVEGEPRAFAQPARLDDRMVAVIARIRAGGMVMDGSVVRGANGLDVSFVLTDYQGSEFEVRYSGILPDLFREGQGVLVQGELASDGVFHAREVLAKHDENYMPPELAGMHDKGKGS